MKCSTFVICTVHVVLLNLSIDFRLCLIYSSCTLLKRLSVGLWRHSWSRSYQEVMKKGIFAWIRRYLKWLSSKMLFLRQSSWKKLRRPCMLFTTPCYILSMTSLAVKIRCLGFILEWAVCIVLRVVALHYWAISDVKDVSGIQQGIRAIHSNIRCLASLEVSASLGLSVKCHMVQIVRATDAYWSIP